MAAIMEFVEPTQLKTLPERIRKSAGVPCFVYFKAQWCPDCDRSSPIVAQALGAGACKAFWVDVGDKPTFRDKDSEVRKLCKDVWLVKCLPTLIFIGSDGSGTMLDRVDEALEQEEDPVKAAKVADHFVRQSLTGRSTAIGQLLALHPFKFAAGAVAMAAIAAVVMARKK